MSNKYVELKLPDYIQELMDSGVKVELKKMTVDGKPPVIGLRIEGFYKSGTADLVPYEGSLAVDFEVFTRYDQRENCSSMTDLLFIHMEWWERSKDKSAGWKQPDEKWVPILKKYGLIKEVVSTTYERV